MAIPEGLTSQVYTLAATVLAPLCLGSGLLRVLGLRFGEGRRAFLAFAFLAGQLALAPVTYLWLVAYQPVPGFVLPLTAAVLGVALLAWKRDRHDGKATRPDWPIALCALLCIAVLADRCLLVNLGPIMAGDEGMTWTAKARVLYTAPDFNLGMGLAFHVGNADYPMLNPLAQVLAFASSGRVLTFESRLPIQAFSAFLLLLLSASLSRRASRPVAAAILIAFTSTTFLHYGTLVMGDVMLSFTMLAAAEAWLRWRETGAIVHARLGWLAIAAALATKNEGQPLSIVAGIAVLASWWFSRRPAAGQERRGLRWNWGWALLPLVVVALGTWFNRHYGLVCVVLQPNVSGGMGLVERCVRFFPDHIGIVARSYGEELIRIEGRWIVLSCLAAAAIGWRAWWRTPLCAPVLFVVGGLACYILVYVGLPGPVEWNLQTAASRMILHLLPVAALTLGALLGKGRREADGLKLPSTG